MFAKPCFSSGHLYHFPSLLSSLHLYPISPGLGLSLLLWVSTFSRLTYRRLTYGIWNTVFTFLSQLHFSFFHCTSRK